LVPVDERDRALAGGGVHERRVVGHQPEVVVPAGDLPEVRRSNRAVRDRDLVALAGAVVGDGQGFLGHGGAASPASPARSSSDRKFCPFSGPGSAVLGTRERMAAKALPWLSLLLPLTLACSEDVSFFGEPAPAT